MLILIVSIALLVLALVGGLYLTDKYLSGWVFFVAGAALSLLFGFLLAKITDCYEKIEISKNGQKLLQNLKGKNNEADREL